MKKIGIFAIAALTALGLSSCIKGKIEGGPVESSGNHLTVRILGAQETRAVEELAGDDDTAEIENGYIFVFNGTGDIVTSEAFSADIKTGQTLTKLVPANAKVYLVANATIETVPANLDDLKALVANISTQTDYMKTTLVNSNQEAKNITIDTQYSAPGPGEASVSIALAPAVSRLELVQVRDTNPAGTVPKVVVTGVFVTDYYNQFTMAADYAGDIIKYTVEGTPGLGDQHEPGIAAVSKVYIPEAGKGWAYQVPGGGSQPKLIIRLYGEGVDQSTRYLMVTGYGDTFEGFKAGTVYRIGEIPFNSAEFTALPEEPVIPEGYELEVKVTVDPWEIVPLVPIM